ncbi:hypothetical protein KM043_017184 [Ampulex compressa]|nr:hypothetical protein KM043_017184 [Ampulex compressa]
MNEIYRDSDGSNIATIASADRTVDMQQRCGKEEFRGSTLFARCNRVEGFGVRCLPRGAYIHVVADDEEAAAFSKSTEGLSPSLPPANAFVLRWCFLNVDEPAALGYWPGICLVTRRAADKRLFVKDGREVKE